MCTCAMHASVAAMCCLDEMWHAPPGVRGLPASRREREAGAFGRLALLLHRSVPPRGGFTAGNNAPYSAAGEAVESTSMQGNCAERDTGYSAFQISLSCREMFAVQGAKCSAEIGSWGSSARSTMLSYSSTLGFLHHAAV